MGYRALDANGRKSSPPPPCEKALTKPDAPLTKEALGIAVDIDNGDTRMAAMDNLEMLVENIDNANAISHSMCIRVIWVVEAQRCYGRRFY
ncbi:hypothetical protein PAXINDRAFT_97604 [Paxillus involutus ATCC 200175]|nr:hypothetical protein PAXINDRAFT_97604 [Paxillus involutus ATCC 200175]